MNLLTAARNGCGTENLTKKQLGKIERTIEYHQELLSCTAAECETRIPEFSEAIAQVELALRDLAEMYDGLAKVPRFEHCERSSLLLHRPFSTHVWAKPAQDGEHQAPLDSRGIGPGVSQ